MKGLAPSRVRRIAVALALAALASAALGSSAASASPKPRPSAMPAKMRALAGPLTRSLFPWASAQAEDGGNGTILVGAPMQVTKGGFTYEMDFSAFGSPAFDGFTFPPDIETSLTRHVAVLGEPAAFQLHDYGFSPDSGVTFSSASDASTATLDTGAAIDPSHINLSYLASGDPVTSRCRLAGGGYGTLYRSTGALTDHRFALATGTSPVFGTITTAPRTASLISDPGCSEISISVDAQGGEVLPCSGRTTLSSGSGGFAGGSFWIAELGIGGGRLLQASELYHQAQATYDDHVVIAALHPAGLVTRRDSHGARARMLTTGNPFMHGSAFFASHGAPRTSVVQRCFYGRHVHHFVGTKYNGTLTPQAPALTAAFDTGASVLVTEPGTLIFRHYLD